MLRDVKMLRRVEPGVLRSSTRGAASRTPCPPRPRAAASPLAFDAVPPSVRAAVMAHVCEVSQASPASVALALDLPTATADEVLRSLAPATGARLEPLSGGVEPAVAYTFPRFTRLRLAAARARERAASLSLNELEESVMRC